MNIHQHLAQHKINRANLTTQGAQEMKTALFALALLLTGCITEPKVYVTDCRGIPTWERPGSDSTVVMDQYCRTEEK